MLYKYYENNPFAVKFEIMFDKFFFKVGLMYFGSINAGAKPGLDLTGLLFNIIKPGSVAKRLIAK